MKRERDGDEKKIQNFTDMLFSHFLSFHDPCMLSPSEEMFLLFFSLKVCTGEVYRKQVAEQISPGKLGTICGSRYNNTRAYNNTGARKTSSFSENTGEREIQRPSVRHLRRRGRANAKRIIIRNILCKQNPSVKVGIATE